MGKALFSSTRSNTSDELCREWIGNFLQGMEDAGFVRTADTGQVQISDLPGLVRSAGQFVYAMYRFDDDLQTTHPIVFKVEFNASSTTSGSSIYSLFLTVGKGSDGAGNVTSVIRPRNPVSDNNAPINSAGSLATPLDHVASTGDGYAAVLACVNNPNASGSPSAAMGFIIERSRTHEGALSGDGLLVVGMNGSASGLIGSAAVLAASNFSVMAINYASGQYMSGGAPVTGPGSVNGALLGASTSLAAGSIGPVFPWDLVAPGLAPWRSCVVISIPAGDMPGGVFETNLCGQMGTFYPIRPSASHSKWGIAFDGDAITRWFGGGIRWED